MKKILYISDGMFTADKFRESGLVDEFKKFEEKGYELAFAEDKGAQRGLKPEEVREAVLRLEKEGPEWVVQDKEFLDQLEDAEVAIMHYSAAGSAFFDAAKNLKLLCTMRSGLENINVDSAKEHGVMVTTSPGRASEPVADFTVTLMLALDRDLVNSDMSKTKVWNPEMKRQKMMKECTVGLVGFGIIGAKVAKRLKGFGCRIITYDPYCNVELLKEYGVERIDDLCEMMSMSDFVSVHARLLESTKGLIGEKEIAAMKPDAYLVNTARAGLIDEPALVRALQEKKIKGAALDVFSEEPLSPDHPLFKLDNVVITPHMAGNSGNAMLRSIEAPMQVIEAYVNGTNLPYLVK